MKTTTNPGSALCPICQRSFALVTRAAGATFPTHGHTFGNGGRKANRCPVSGFSVAGLAIVQSWIDALAMARTVKAPVAVVVPAVRVSRFPQTRSYYARQAAALAAK